MVSGWHGHKNKLPNHSRYPKMVGSIMHLLSVSTLGGVQDTFHYVQSMLHIHWVSRVSEHMWFSSKTPPWMSQGGECVEFCCA
jgi:hypothetical protein